MSRMRILMGIVLLVLVFLILPRVRRMKTVETFVAPCTPKTQCPDGTRTDGPCLMAFA